MLLGPADGLLGPLVGVEAARQRGSIPVLAGMWDTRTKVQAIAELRPGIIAGAASHIVHLSEAAAEMGIDLSERGLRAATSFGEPGAAIDVMNATIQQRFGVEQIVDGNGLTELLPLGGTARSRAPCTSPRTSSPSSASNPTARAGGRGGAGEIVLRRGRRYPPAAALPQCDVGPAGRRSERAPVQQILRADRAHRGPHRRHHPVRRGARSSSSPPRSRTSCAAEEGLSPSTSHRPR